MNAVFTVDVENPDPRSNTAHVAGSERLLDLLAEAGVRGTLFFVAETARHAPHLVKRSISEGHEIALHSLDHTEITRQTPEQFQATTSQALQILQDISGQAVVGYRAPVFSLVRETCWAADILNDLGFKYSSSVLPGWNPMNGFGGAPRRPFYWPSGLVEFPAPTIPGLNLPYFGGIYFRYLPARLVQMLYGVNQTEDPRWFYCHPYDLDTGDGFIRMQNVSWWANQLLMANRGQTVTRIGKLLREPGIDWLPGFASVLEWLEITQDYTAYTDNQGPSR